MANELDDLDFNLGEIETIEENYDVVTHHEEETETEEDVNVEEDLEDETEEVEDAETGTEEDSLITTLLKNKGIDDSSKIKFVNDSGDVEELDWNDLTTEEKINILSEQESENTNDLDDAEIDLINRMRLSRMTPDEFVSVIKQQGVQEYLAQAGETDVHYTVDDLTDEELYVLDLQARVSEITDEELEEALDRAKSNEALFKKEIAGIREEYKQLEDTKNQQDAALREQQQQEQYAMFANNIANSISGFSNIGELDVDLTQDDMNELYTFITGYNQAGVSYLSQALNDPDTLTRMAWFALKGEDVINSISEYYKKEITKAHRAGIEEGKKKAAPIKKESKVVIKEPEKKKVNEITSIHDLNWT